MYHRQSKYRFSQNCCCCCCCRIRIQTTCRKYIAGSLGWTESHGLGPLLNVACVNLCLCISVRLTMSLAKSNCVTQFGKSGNVARLVKAPNRRSLLVVHGCVHSRVAVTEVRGSTPGIVRLTDIRRLDPASFRRFVVVGRNVQLQ